MNAKTTSTVLVFLSLILGVLFIDALFPANGAHSLLSIVLRLTAFIGLALLFILYRSDH